MTNGFRHRILAHVLILLGCTRLSASGETNHEPPAISPYAFESVDAAAGAKDALQPFIIDQIVYPDGRILGLGYLDTREEQRALLVRWGADGRLDTTFGQRGIATLTNPGGNMPYQFVVDSKGRILVAVLHYKDDPVARMGGMQNPGAVFRFTPEGHLDMTWGEKGIKLVDAVVRQFHWVTSMGIAVLPDDTVLLAYVHLHEPHPRRGGPDTHRIALLRLDETGTPDATFGTDGVAIPATAEPLHINSLRLHILNDGRFLVYGGAQTHTAPPPASWPKAFFGCLTPQGEWDPRIGGGKGYTLHLLGEEATAASVNQAVLTDVAELRNGRVLASGYWLSSPLERKFDAFVVRYLPDGGLDQSFGGRDLGYTEVIRTTKPDWAFSISALRNGNAVVAGTDSKGGYLLQLNANGTQIVWRREALSLDGIDFRHAMDANGRVFITGGRAREPIAMSIRKFNASGAPDTRFGRTRDGIVRVLIRRAVDSQ